MAQNAAAGAARLTQLNTEIGALVLSAAVLSDLLGWICLAPLVRGLDSAGAPSGSMARSFAVTAGFLVVALVALRPIVGAWLGVIARDTGGARATARALSMIMILTLLGATATEWLGIHAMFGGFVVGLAIGSSPHLHIHTRHALQDFIDSFDPLLVAIVLVVATVSKVFGSALGARLGGIAGARAWAVGFGLNSRGAMEIMLASLALDAGMIDEKMFVALVIMAITTSLISGPVMARLVRTTATYAPARPRSPPSSPAPVPPHPDAA